VADDLLHCPKCGSTMEKDRFAEVEVDRCVNCGGLWFDFSEAEHLRHLRGAAELDTGRAQLGSQYDRVDRIDCPRCRTRMIVMTDLDQPHLHFESCIRCFGTFFDAGEFRDFSHRDLLSRLRDLWSRIQPRP
jgi:Zn-finger nucleic acid-binding protein